MTGSRRWRQENSIVMKIRTCLPASMAAALLGMAIVWMSACASGCDDTAPAGYVEIKPPLSFTLPHTISIHPFTSLRTIDNQGQRLEVRMEAKDAYQDTTKAFGKFRFELYSFKPISPNHKGELIDSWEEDITGGQTNLIHWDPITRSYVFRLVLSASIPPGRILVLTASFETPYSTSRLFPQDDYVFTSQ
jgi:hypothetical protein